MPSCSRLNAIPRLGVLSPRTAIVVLTMETIRRWPARRRARARAASSLKDAAKNDLLQAIRAAGPSGG